MNEEDSFSCSRKSTTNAAAPGTVRQNWTSLSWASGYLARSAASAEPPRRRRNAAARERAVQPGRRCCGAAAVLLLLLSPVSPPLPPRMLLASSILKFRRREAPVSVAAPEADAEEGDELDPPAEVEPERARRGDSGSAKEEKRSSSPSPKDPPERDAHLAVVSCAGVGLIFVKPERFVPGD